jgi:hypothetical protein
VPRDRPADDRHADQGLTNCDAEAELVPDWRLVVPVPLGDELARLREGHRDNVECHAASIGGSVTDA